MTALESKLYVALLAVRPIIAATANVNPKALPTKKIVDDALAAYKRLSDAEQPEESTDAAGE
jgi:hypothetical protein